MNLTKAQITELFTTSNALGSFAGNPQPNLQIDALEPGEYTLQFQTVETPIDALGFATYAIVRWKVKGQQIQRILSVFSGAVLGGVAEAVDVALLDQSNRGPTGVFFALTADLTHNSPLVTLGGGGAPINLSSRELVFFSSQPGIGYALAGPVSNIGPGNTFQLATPFTGPTGAGNHFYAQSPYKIGVVLSKGTRPTIMQPPVLLTTALTVQVSTQSSAPVLVPQDAGVISVLVTVNVSSPPVVSQNEAKEGVVAFASAAGITDLQYSPVVTPGWYPIPPGTLSLLFLNCSTTQALQFTYQFGIEG